MIFVTVGTQLPFPRLIDTMNALATDLDEEIVAQCGPVPAAPPAELWPHLICHTSLTPKQFEDLFTRARLIVGHAGIGTVLSARKWGKPLVVLPRRHELMEHRNDHQLATARQVEALPGVHVAWQAEEIRSFLMTPDLTPASQAQSPSHMGLIIRLRDFING